MTSREQRISTRVKYLLAVTFATCAAVTIALGSSAQKAEAYWVCGPTSEVVRPAFFRCQHGTYRPTISYIQKLSSPRAYAVYRSSTPGGSSISGSEFYSPTSDYFLQNFHCNPGYPNAHNRHSVPVYVAYTLAASC